MILSPPQAPRTILVHMNRNPVDAYGEVFLRLPFFKALRNWAPDTKITIIPGIGGANFWEGLIHPITRELVDEVIRDAIPDPKVRKFDWVFDLEGDALTSFKLRRLARRKFHTVALKGFLNFPNLPRYHGKHITKRYLGALKQATRVPNPPPWPYAFPKRYRDAVDRLLPSGKTYIGFAPGAGVQFTGKCWPIERYVEVARRQLEVGRTPVVFLSVGESGWEEHFAELEGVIFPLSENAKLEGSVPSDPVLSSAIGEKLNAAVTNCNGTGHMLAFGGAPMITLFGPSNPVKFCPFARDFVHLTPPDHKNRKIEEIGVPKVIEAINMIVGRCSPIR
jgi:ADP-heptose:LPS heptosyltransferase